MKSLALKTVGLLGCAAFLTCATLQAGEIAEAAAPVTVAQGSMIDPISGVVSVGYDSHYMFRGFNRGQEAPWAEVDLSMPVGNFTVNAGAWYTNPTQGAQNTVSRGALDDELDLYASIATTIGAFDVAVGYTHYHFPEQVGGIDNNEVGISVGTSWNRLDFSVGYYYNFDLGDPGATGVGALDHYIEPAVGTSMDLTDRVGLSVGVSAGWYSTDFSHLQYTASFPISVAENVTLEPYVAYLDNRNSGQLENVAGQADNDDFFAGASLSVSF